MTAVLSVDVGGTKTLLGTVHADGRVEDAHTVTTRVGGDDIERVVALTAAAARDRRPVAVSVGFPEYVSPDGSLTSHEVLTWGRQP
ncbi:hypothetical protein, partial [Microbacterium sp.]|uniref:hypothetical protein n=1 Tax=Microbacterium sp. TaxID=51671 RepID=UPI003A8C215D